MEYVHLKDYRGSGTEPVNVLSQYKYQDGLAYYESTRDTASHFFIDYLPKGTYVFEYATRVRAQGQVPDRHRLDPVHVRPRVQQPLGEPAAGGEVAAEMGEVHCVQCGGYHEAGGNVRVCVSVAPWGL